MIKNLRSANPLFCIFFGLVSCKKEMNKSTIQEVAAASVITLKPPLELYDPKVHPYGGNSEPGRIDGPLLSSRFATVSAFTADNAGNIYIAAYGNNRIRKIDVNGIVSSIAGGDDLAYIDGTASLARFFGPTGITIDGNGNLFIADQFNHRIRKMTPGGLVTTYAGSGIWNGFADGPRLFAKFTHPTAIIFDPLTNSLYVADRGNHRIRKISPDGMVSTVAGTGAAGLVNGSVSIARFNWPYSLVLDKTGNIYVSEHLNHAVRKISGSIVTTLAGNGTPGYVDGQGTAAQFHSPHGIAITPSGTLYIADAANKKIRSITPAGLVKTYAGSVDGYANGERDKARFNYPTAVFYTPSLGVLVGDYSSIRRIGPPPVGH